MAPRRRKKSGGSWRSARGRLRSVSRLTPRGLCSQIRRGTSSASCPGRCKTLPTPEAWPSLAPYGREPANLMAVTVELTLLARVSYGSLEITGSRLQGLLALLAQDPRAGCSASRLVDELWPDEPPEHPFKALQILVSRARARLGP